MTLLGNFALWAALLFGVWGAVVAFSGKWEGRPDLTASVIRSVYAVFAALVVASIALWKGIIVHDFNIEYVWAYSSRNLPSGYLFSAFWAGQKGSLLFWAVVLAFFSALAQVLTPRRHAAMMPYVAGVTSITTVFFVAVMLFSGANPFDRLPFTPADGRGLNPQLQNPGMMIHPPMLYLGYISITIPFAFAMAALLSKRLDTGWIHAIRKWTIVSWLFLSVGITLGMWWAYVELGWGGYWAWDPVENASFLPWLTMTAFLHSVMIQEKRGMLKRWNLTLIIGTFLLSIFGTFITRSGVIASVHSFTQSNVGYFFLGFLFVTAVAAYTLLYTRWPLLEADVELESMVSREAAFLFNNLLLVGIAFSVLWGTLFPIISEAVRGTKITVGPPFFNKVNVPLGLLLLALTGIGPLIAWRKASTANLRRQFVVPVLWGVVAAVALLALGVRQLAPVMTWSLAAFVMGTVVQEFWRGTRARVRMHGESIPLAFAHLMGRNRRRYGGYLVHVGILTYFVAFAGEAFKVEKEATLKPGQSLQLKSPFGHTYTFTHVGISQYKELNRYVSAASVQVQKDGKAEGTITSEKRQHFTINEMGAEEKSFEPSTEVGIRSGLQEDVYIVFAGAVNGTEEAVYRFNLNPLTWWVWAGGVILVLGGLVTMWPGGGTQLAPKRGAQSGYGVELAAEPAGVES
jgi:cytochrome c-type biogenesis protein CcmF